MKLQQTQIHCIDTQPRRNGSWFENLIDESFPSPVCCIYLHVCFYRLSPLLVLTTNITVKSPGQIKLRQCKTTRIACRRFRGRSIGKIIRLDNFCFLLLIRAPSESYIPCTYPLRSDMDFPRFSVKYLLPLFPNFTLHGSGLLELPSVGVWFQPSLYVLNLVEALCHLNE